jgi:dTDP-4-dehydrorhamnose 3,5-epimerase
MKAVNTSIDDLLVISPNVFMDSRGFFMESFRLEHFKKLGIDEIFVQDNHSQSSKNVIRGLHFQWDKPLSKLIRVTRGEAFVVAADIRKKSKTFGQAYSLLLSEDSKKQLWAPFGFATGFCTCSDIAEVQYKCTATYNPNAESGINPFDRHLNIDWPISQDEAILSAKDLNAISFKDWNKKEESSAFK